MKVIIDGRKYELIPVDEDDTILDDYKVKDRPDRTGGPDVEETTGIKEAVPKVSEYRERYKQKKVRAGEVSAPPKRYSKLDKEVNDSLSGYQYKGEQLFVGPGIQEDI